MIRNIMGLVFVGGPKSQVEPLLGLRLELEQELGIGLGLDPAVSQRGDQNYYTETGSENPRKDVEMGRLGIAAGIWTRREMRAFSQASSDNMPPPP